MATDNDNYERIQEALIELANEIEAEGRRYVEMFDETSYTAATLFGYAARIFEILEMEYNYD